MRPADRLLRWGVLAALLLASLIIPFMIWGEALETWIATADWTGTAPTLAATAGALLLAADIVLPVPSSLVMTMLGTVLGAWLGTVAGAAGLTVSCVLGYALGRAIGTSAAGRLVGRDELGRAAAWLDRYGTAALVVCRAVPVLAEASIVAAGVMRMDPIRVCTATALANIGVSGVYATLGASADGAWQFLLAFALSITLPGLALAAARVIERRRVR